MTTALSHYQPLPRPALGARQTWNFPEPTVTQLPNGLTVWTYQLPGQYVVSMEFVFDVALCDEPAGKEGLATLALRCCDEGSLSHPGNALAEKIEDIGANFDGAATRWATRAGVDVGATYAHQAIDLLHEIVRNPAYDETDVERHRLLALTEIEQMRANSSSMASAGMRQALWAPGSRSALGSLGTAQSISELTASHVRDFHHTWWRPDNATLVLAGDFPDGFTDHIAEVFSDWDASDIDRTIVPSPMRDGALPVLFIDRPEAVAADIRLGLIGPVPDGPDWAGLQVATEAVGGAFGSRLNMTLREQLGYTYGVQAGFSAGRFASSFAVQTSVRTDVAAPACRQLFDLLDISNNSLTDQETSDAIDSLIANAPLRYDTAEAIAGQAGALAARKFSPTRINDVHKAISETTAAQATDAFCGVIGSAITENELRLVVCGNGAELIPQLEAEGFHVEITTPVL